MRLNGPTRTGFTTGSVFLLIFTLFWCCVLAVLDRDLMVKVWQQARSGTFLVARGRVLKSEVSREHGRKGRYSHGVEVLYVYSVGGRSYTNDLYAFQAVRSSDPKWAYTEVNARPKGSETSVYYDSAAPEVALLRRGIDGSDVFILIFLTPFHLIAVGLLSFLVSPIVRAVRSSSEDFTMASRIRERIFVGDGGPMVSFLAAFGAGSFIGIFVLAVAFGFHPKLKVAVAVWSAALVWGIWAALSTWRKIRAGEFDVVVDHHAAKVTLPAMHGRTEPEEVSFADVERIEAREVYEIPHSKYVRKRSRKVAEVVLRTKNGAEWLVKKPWSLAEGKQWARWLQRRLVG